jgi:tetratricopeptide (TPR) repeat protein
VTSARAAGEDGESLAPLVKGGSRKEVPISLAESWYPRLHFGWSELRSARAGNWKFVGAPKPELYDLQTDRGETKNVASGNAAVVKRLAAELARASDRLKDARPTRNEQPDPATIQRLQSLGYLGSFSPAAAGDAKEDPKDHIAQYREYRTTFSRALSLLGRGQHAEAVAALQQLVKMNVRAFEAHLYLGNAYAAQGKTNAALGEYDAASLLNPELATPHIEAAKVLSNANQHAVAIVRCRKGLDLSPRSDYGHYTLGVIYRRAQKPTDAADAFTRAVELNPANVRARSGLAATAMQLGRTEVAAAQFEQLIELGFQVAPSHFNLGIIAATRGDRAEAAHRFRLALKADPAFKPAQDALAKLK